MTTGELYIIATPIGNMEDITYRAVKVLQEIDVLFCEDTRETKKLLEKYQIKVRLISNNEENESKNVKKYQKMIEEGKKIGLVSDRGTPLISDPGYEILQAAIANDDKIIAIPGPCAFVTALVTSGLPVNSFSFHGFLSKNTGKRRKSLQKLQKNEETLVFYETANRLLSTLKMIEKEFGNRQIIISREITKKFEEHIRGEINEVIPKIKNIKGEIVLIVAGNNEKQEIDEKQIKKELKNKTKEGLSPNKAIKLVAEELEIPKNKVYKIFHGL